MAGITGFEPIQTESKSVVLPLHYIPMCKKSIVKVTHRKSGRTYRLYLNTLRSMGESLLPIWRKKHVIYKCCL